MSGLAFSKYGVSFCISIMWPLLTVAMTRSVAAAPVDAITRPAVTASVAVSFMGPSPVVSGPAVRCGSERTLGALRTAFDTPRTLADIRLHLYARIFPYLMREGTRHDGDAKPATLLGSAA